MSIGLGRGATRELTRVKLALLPRRRRRGWLAGSVLVVGALSIGAVLSLGAGGSDLHLGHVFRDVQQPAAVAQDTQLLRKQLEQIRLTLSLSEARSQGLEHQIDALNRRLRECQEELTFFRKAGDGKHN